MMYRMIGLSAGAICWFSDIYTDSAAALGEGDKYAMFEGLNWIKGKQQMMILTFVPLYLLHAYMRMVWYN